MIKVFAALYVNTALITLFVNADLDTIPFLNFTPVKEFVFHGRYYDLEKEWYVRVGATFVTTMIIQVFSPHWTNLFIAYPMKYLIRTKFHHWFKT